MAFSSAYESRLLETPLCSLTSQVLGLMVRAGEPTLRAGSSPNSTRTTPPPSTIPLPALRPAVAARREGRSRGRTEGEDPPWSVGQAGRR